MQKRFAPITRSLAVVIFILVMAWLFGVAFSTSGFHLSEFRYNAFVPFSAIGFAINVLVLLYISRQRNDTAEGFWLYITTLLVTLLAVSDLMQRLSATPEAALFWANLGTPAAIMGPAIFLFVLEYTNQTARRFHLLSATLIVGSLAYVFFSNFTNIIFVNFPKAATLQAWGWDYSSAIGPASAVAGIWYIGLFILAIARLISFRRHIKSVILKRQTTIFIVALVIPALTGIVFTLLLPVVGVTFLPITGPASLFMMIILLYGIRKYQILNVDPAQYSSTILELLSEAVVVVDDEYSVIYLNPSAKKLLGINTDRATSKQNVTLHTVFTPESIQQLQQSFQAAPAGGSFGLERVNVGKEDSQDTTPVRLSGSRYNVANYQTWILVLSDITAELHTRSVIEHEVRVRTRELNQARTYLLASINSLTQGFILVNQHARIELLNHRAQQLFSVTNAAANQSIAKALPSDGWSINIGKAINHALNGHHARHFETGTSDGSFYQVYITPVISQDDHPLGATVVIQDVTEAKILDRSKDEFFSIASHELRTPLTAIRGNMSMAKDYFGEQLKDSVLHDLVDDTHAASVRLIEIVNDFLDSSRLEQGKMVFTFGAVKVAPLVAAVADDLKPLWKQQGNTVTVTGLESLPSTWADEGRLRQVLYNVISNANKYSKHATVTVSGSIEDHKLQLRIADTGKGISAENQKLLFHKFQQAGESILTRDNTKGTGLGLYISKLLATQMHGDVRLEHSEEGKGSTFVVTMPLATTRLAAQTTAKITPVPPLTA